MKLITEYNDSLIEFKTEETEDSEGLKIKDYYIEGIFMQADIKNRNGRVYTREVLKPAVDRYIKEQVEQDRAVGELNHPCFHQHTELLIENQGWKPISEAREGELAYTLNRKTGEIEKKPILKVIRNKYDGKMYRIKGRGIDTTVTPDHKFVILNRRGEYDFYTTEELIEGWKDRSLSHCGIPKATFNWDTNYDPEKTVVIPALDPVKMNRSEWQKDLHINELDFAAFMGFWLADGGGEKNGRGFSVFQTKEENIEPIREMLKRLPFEWEETSKTSEETGKTGYMWHCRDMRMGMYLRQFGNCYQKYLDDKCLSLSPRASWELIKWFALGDGRKNTYNSGIKDVFSTSIKLINGLSELLVKCGIAHVFKTTIVTEDYTFAGRMITAENRKPLYHLEILSTKTVSIDNRFLKIEETINDSDYVYCINVENNTFMVRDAGRNFWSGNCGPTVNLDKVSHKIESLYWDGANVMGRAKILDTPMGVTVKKLLDGGVRLGVSSRGMGSIVKKEGVDFVKDDFVINTVDIVQDPSAHHAFVNGVMEGVEWAPHNGGFVQIDEFMGIPDQGILAFKEGDRVEYKRIADSEFKGAINDASTSTGTIINIVDDSGVHRPGLGDFSITRRSQTGYGSHKKLRYFVVRDEATGKEITMHGTHILRKLPVADDDYLTPAKESQDLKSINKINESKQFIRAFRDLMSRV